MTGLSNCKNAVIFLRVVFYFSHRGDFKRTPVLFDSLSAGIASKTNISKGESQE
jgi:hypothetical protein